MQDQSTHQGGGAAGASTGDVAVDEALRSLDRLESRPVHEHSRLIENAHRALQDRLADEPADDTPEGQG